MRKPWKDKEPAYVTAEKKQAKRPGARPQLNSGRTWSGKGDVIEAGLMIDNKTGKDGPLNSYRITNKYWTQMKKDANRTGLDPALRLDIGSHELIVVDQATWDARGQS